MTDDERVIEIMGDALERDRKAIDAIHARLARNPVLDLLWRRPWRAHWGPMRGDTWQVTAGNLWSWLRGAHDCADPSVACSCSGSFRFPRPRI